eukprot:1160217-Pelagomonas_calceolata.AAC.1
MEFGLQAGFQNKERRLLARNHEGKRLHTPGPAVCMMERSYSTGDDIISIPNRYKRNAAKSVYTSSVFPPLLQCPLKQPRGMPACSAQRTNVVIRKLDELK